MTQQMIIASERWRAQHPGSVAAVVMYRGLSAANESRPLAAMKRDLEAVLRDRWGAATKLDFYADPTIAAYQRHDQRFGQNYHVAMQTRSIAQKGKPIPDRNPLIEAMFMTELKTGVLAAAQDADQIAFPITVDSADGSERYTRYDGVAEFCKAGDQVMIDAGGNVLTSIAQGPTSYGLVGPQTTAVAYCFYFPDGVANPVIEAALAYLDTCVTAACPGAERIAHQSVTAA